MTILTLTETADGLHRALRDYIEATYHISDESLVRERRQLLDEPAVIRQHAYIESTPRYETGRPFEELGLPDAALEVLLRASQPTPSGERLVHNPPFEHQAESLQGILSDTRSLIVTTGTGSGKTECFMLPMLGRLANEAATNPGSFNIPAVRALFLYPMNALVNDQLARLRLLFGNESIVSQFTKWSGRPARFARYTSRTLYPGVRTSKKDQRRLLPLGNYYVKIARRAAGEGDAGEVKRAKELMAELKGRGKWPGKPDIVRWYGEKGDRWIRDGEFVRCVTLPEDPELLTRHEVLAAPPDILVTNYSMLEYMLMRPLERQLFDMTRDWLADNPHETFLLVVDEAHLYRGASGTEVGLLIRRLRQRLGISPDRLQIICTSASFQKLEKAQNFAATLTGKTPDDFEVIPGRLALRDNAGVGTSSQAEMLASLDMSSLYSSDEKAELRSQLAQALDAANVQLDDLRTFLYELLRDFPPMNLLVNETMQRACPISELGSMLFPDVEATISEKAVANLVALGSYAREEGKLDGPGLLPARVHAFFRGLPGLWACVDPDCPELSSEDRGGPTGKLYAQPSATCRCGGRVFEFFTCRQCGTPYARGYTDSIEAPQFLWPESGQILETPTEDVPELIPIDILLGTHAPDARVRPADLDITTGRLDSPNLGDRVRSVFLPSVDPAEGDTSSPASGSFTPCALCGKHGTYGRSTVQDHQTKGDEPFRALVTKQVEVQQPTGRPTPFTPLAGRKVLIFSDSRQTAARLAPNIQKYTTRDAIRPLLVAGFDWLRSEPTTRRRLSLDDAYLAILIASANMGVRLRPPTKTGENFESDLKRVKEFLESAHSKDPEHLLDLLIEISRQNPPEYLLRAIHDVVNDQYYGLTSLALASLAEVESKASVVDQLPNLGDEIVSEDQKRDLLHLWLDSWGAQWLKGMPTEWARTEIQPKSGKFADRFKRVLSTNLVKDFSQSWIPILLEAFAERADSKFFLKGSMVSLQLGGEWAYCQTCRSTQRPFPWIDRCTTCGQKSLSVIDPDNDPVFVARKGYFRRDTVEALDKGLPPLALIAAEHTAQLNAAQADEVFSDAEEHELLFQDVDLGEGDPAIDVLSCTTTMEVGIDIGALAGVALRNMPPSRANYQQRAGRAGRRSRAVATVTAFANSDSHDEHGFREPDEVIRGEVIDPELRLENWQIARRHLNAFLLQEYLQERIPPQVPVAEDGDGVQYGAQLFEVLGTVAGFTRPDSILNRQNFREWLEGNASRLAHEAQTWLPAQLEESRDVQSLEKEIRATLDLIDRAVGYVEDPVDIESEEEAEEASGESEEDAAQLEIPAETGDATPSGDSSGTSLLDRLLYKSVLPRYAFPTDVAAFHVFARDSSPYRPLFQYTPSQSLPVALSQYAPGKTVWIAGKEWRSGAIYSPMSSDRYDAWQSRRWYLECRVCGYATTADLESSDRGEERDCPACGTPGKLGPARTWFRPPGFAHPHTEDEGTSPDDQPPPSYATRAKLVAQTPSDQDEWKRLNNRLKLSFEQSHLLVSNSGPKSEGYSYCTKCGLIEPAINPTSVTTAEHRKPYPDNRRPLCQAGGTARNVVLGTDFISDVLLISLGVEDPLTLRPEFTSTRIALRTLSEAFTNTACQLLGIDSGELAAEFRPALTARGKAGLEAEIYMYDTLSGGAGFAKRVGDLGLTLFESALTLLERCPHDCDASCYRCLRSYKNKFDHPHLDRHLGASLLRYLLHGTEPSLDPSRVASTEQLLIEDLDRLGLSNTTIEKDATVVVPEFGTLNAPILLTHSDGRRAVLVTRVPFTTNVLTAPEWQQVAEYTIDPQVVPVDELSVRAALPRATRNIITTLGLK